jgi:hypothetical protein
MDLKDWTWKPAEGVGVKRGLLLERLGFGEVDLEETGQLDISFLLSTFLHSLLLLDLGPVQMASARVFTTYHWRWSFPVRRIHRKVTLERYRSAAGFMRPYEGVRVWIFTFFPSLIMYGYGSPGGLQLERRMM